MQLSGKYLKGLIVRSVHKRSNACILMLVYRSCSVPNLWLLRLWVPEGVQAVQQQLEGAQEWIELVERRAEHPT